MTIVNPMGISGYADIYSFVDSLARARHSPLTTPDGGGFMPFPERSKSDDAEVKEFCRRIALAMQLRQLSQSELSRRIGCQQSVISEWLYKNRAPSGLYILRLPDALEVDGHWLVTGGGEMDRVPTTADEMPASYARGGLAALARIEEVLTMTRRDLLAQDAAIQKAIQAAALAAQVRPVHMGVRIAAPTPKKKPKRA